MPEFKIALFNKSNKSRELANADSVHIIPDPIFLLEIDDSLYDSKQVRGYFIDGKKARVLEFTRQLCHVEYKVRLVKPSAGYPVESMAMKALIDKGTFRLNEIYTVTQTDVEDFFTYIRIQDFDSKLNMSMFEVVRN